jgi:hypothetical protein
LFVDKVEKIKVSLFLIQRNEWLTK